MTTVKITKDIISKGNFKIKFNDTNVEYFLSVTDKGMILMSDGKGSQSEMKITDIKALQKKGDIDIIDLNEVAMRKQAELDNLNARLAKQIELNKALIAKKKEMEDIHVNELRTEKLPIEVLEGYNEKRKKKTIEVFFTQWVKNEVFKEVYDNLKEMYPNTYYYRPTKSIIVGSVTKENYNKTLGTLRRRYC